MIREKQELESRLSEYEDMAPDNHMRSKTSFHNMEKVEFEARLQDVK
jgi:hypothetical protein